MGSGLALGFGFDVLPVRLAARVLQVELELEARPQPLHLVAVRGRVGGRAWVRVRVEVGVR